MNIIKHTDSYKLSHFKQYPPGTLQVSSYIEARKANCKEIKTDKVVFFGLQAYIKKYLIEGSFLPRDIDIAARMAKLHGVPFNEDGWRYISSEYDGRLPLFIEAIPEGSVVDIGTPLVQLTNTDPRVPWLTNYIETSLLRAIWYPTTVATLSYSIKKMMKRYWDESVDVANQNQLDYGLHDFGARGVSSSESAELGGMSHLLSFNGSDTAEALYAADRFYPEVNITGHSSDIVTPFATNYIAGYSVPAAEHSTITSWGEANEEEAIANMVEQFGGEGKIYSVVMDSYDIFHSVDRITDPDFLNRIRFKGGRFVIRPDSGDPVMVILKLLYLLKEKLGDEIKLNEKGFFVLPPYFRIIQGDGVNYYEVEDILVSIMKKGWSAENIVFGMGGALLQKVNRDTLGFAMKCNAIKLAAPLVGDDVWIPIAKKPKGDPGKNSKPGRISFEEQKKLGMRLVYDSGITMSGESFSDIQKRVRETI